MSGENRLLRKAAAADRRDGVVLVDSERETSDVLPLMLSRRGIRLAMFESHDLALNQLPLLLPRLTVVDFPSEDEAQLWEAQYWNAVRQIQGSLLMLRDGRSKRQFSGMTPSAEMVMVRKPFEFRELLQLVIEMVERSSKHGMEPKPAGAIGRFPPKMSSSSTRHETDRNSSTRNTPRRAA